MDDVTLMDVVDFPPEDFAPSRPSLSSFQRPAMAPMHLNHPLNAAEARAAAETAYSPRSESEVSEADIVYESPVGSFTSSSSSIPIHHVHQAHHGQSQAWMPPPQHAGFYPMSFNAQQPQQQQPSWFPNSAPAALAPIMEQLLQSKTPSPSAAVAAPSGRRRRASQPATVATQPVPLTSTGAVAMKPRRLSQPDSALAQRAAALALARRSVSGSVSEVEDMDVDEDDDDGDESGEVLSGDEASSGGHYSSIVTPAGRNVPDPDASFKLPVSKSPIMDALCYCALQGWGLRVHLNRPAQGNGPATVVFLVEDFERYYQISRSICSKQNPTEDIGARVKALRRWFSNFPAKRDRTETGVSFELAVRHAGVRKVRQLIEENAALLGLLK